MMKQEEPPVRPLLLNRSFKVRFRDLQPTISNVWEFLLPLLLRGEGVDCLSLGVILSLSGLENYDIEDTKKDLSVRFI